MEAVRPVAPCSPSRGRVETAMPFPSKERPENLKGSAAQKPAPFFIPNDNGRPRFRRTAHRCHEVGHHPGPGSMPSTGWGGKIGIRSVRWWSWGFFRLFLAPCHIIVLANGAHTQSVLGPYPRMTVRTCWHHVLPSPLAVNSLRRPRYQREFRCLVGFVDKRLSLLCCAIETFDELYECVERFHILLAVRAPYSALIGVVVKRMMLAR